MPDDILQRFKALRVWKTRGKRAPHKPLLALWAIGRCLRGDARLAPFGLVDRKLAELLQQFGPHRKTIHTEDPFWRMQRDEVWEVEQPELVRSTKEGGAFKSDLKRHEIHGGLTEADYSAFRTNPRLAIRVAEDLVATHFPPTLQNDVLDATSIPVSPSTAIEAMDDRELFTSRRRPRDPAFRSKVLAAYGNQCAVCEFAVQRGNLPLALEAAHIKWHEAKGPAEVENGLALCTLHHDLFDRGAFTVLPGLKVLVANDVDGEGVEQSLLRFDGERLRAGPQQGYPVPAMRFLAWHLSEVFRNPSQSAT